MRISIATGAFLSLPPAPCGSVERVWHDLGCEFARRGHQVTFLASAYSGSPDRESAGNITIIRQGNWKRTGVRAFDIAIDLAYSLRMLPKLPSADIFVANVFWLPALAWLRPRTGKRVIVLNRHPKGQLALYRGAARLAVVSRAVMDAVAEESKAALAITKVLPNIVDVQRFVPPTVPRSFDGEQTFIFTGRMHPEKGLELLIDAFAQTSRRRPGLRLRLIGPSAIPDGGGGEHYLQSLRNRAAGLPVEFVPPIYDRVALAAELQKAHYYCYPSLAEKGESFPVAPLEAMATGLVPIVSGLACFKDFIDDGVSGLAFDHRAPDAVDRLAACMSRALSDPVTTAEMGRQATAQATQFSCARVADLYLEDFESILANVDSAPVASSKPNPAG